MIEVELRHQQGDFSLDVSFRSEGGVVGLFGPSGSGKTTVIRAISGLLHPDDGRIVLGRRVLFDRRAGVVIPPHKRRVGYVFQEPRLFPHLTVERNLRYGQPVPAPVGPVAELLGLTHLLARAPRDLSGGEAQRVAIGRALLSAPEVLLMDEPLAALDPARKEEILPYLAAIRDQARIPIFYVSHALEEVAQLASDLVVIRNGGVSRAGPIGEVLADPDAVPDIGLRDAGALLQGVLEELDAGDGLSRVRVGAHGLLLPAIHRPRGARVQIRILATDVILARQKPHEISALNILPVEVTQIFDGSGPGVAVALRSGEDRLIARITRRSARLLQLSTGAQVFAVIKSISVAPGNVAGARALDSDRTTAQQEGEA